MDQSKGQQSSNQPQQTPGGQPAQAANPPGGNPAQKGDAPGPLPREGGPAPGNQPPLGSPADLGAATTFRPGPSAPTGEAASAGASSPGTTGTSAAQSTPGGPGPSGSAGSPASKHAPAEQQTSPGPVSADTQTAPPPGGAPRLNPAQPAVATPDPQADAKAAITAQAPPVVGDQTTSPPPSPATSTPSPATEAANRIAGGAVTETVSGGRSTGQSASVAATDAAVADRMRPMPEPAPVAPEPPSGADAGARAAALIRDQLDILTLRIVYDAQELVRVGAEGPDPVTVRTILETFAAALERGDQQTFSYTYSRAARPNVPQINDQVLPFRIGLQVGGMFEGVMRDAFNEGFEDDPALRAASVRLLEQMAGPAKLALLGEPRELVQWQAPRI